MSVIPYSGIKKAALASIVQRAIEEKPIPRSLTLTPEDADTWRLVIDRPAGAAAKGLGALAPNAAGTPIFCIHGVGNEEADPNFKQNWTDAIQNGLRRWNPAAVPLLDFAAYDELFAVAPLGPLEIARAIIRLGASGVASGVSDAVDSIFGRQRGLRQLSERARWTAGMVVQWADNATLRRAAEDRLLARLQTLADSPSTAPKLVLAHSLGSLLAYGAFSRTGLAKQVKDILAEITLVTFGSQIGNPFVRSTIAGGRLEMLPVKRWWHLYNVHDDAFAARIKLRPYRPGDTLNFSELETEFDIPGMLDHDAVEYLSHERTVAVVWREASGAGRARSIAASKTEPSGLVAPEFSISKGKKGGARTASPPARALLVGINDYVNPDYRLEGCVNDTYLMSSVLQERGFRAENIRLLLNDRATTAGLRERVDWLLKNAEDGSPRVLFYSGHGAQIPDYGVDEVADHTDECLVTHDFNWDAKNSFNDDLFFELYSQLPDSARFIAIFDCCHSGGISRNGPLVRGLNPPDDIRHRALRWDKAERMWRLRDFAVEGARAVKASQKVKPADCRRLGRGSPVAETGTKPDHYDPLILEACQEGEQSFEYVDGANSYGAFTFSLAQLLRDPKFNNSNWNEMIKAVSGKLKRLGYQQTARIEGPQSIRREIVPRKI